jgi:GMP synthase-like glutamine amidotransferase
MYRLGLLACDFVPDDLRDRFADYPTMFGTAIANAGIDVDWRIYRVHEGQVPAAVDACDGYITTGSRSGVYEDHAWIPLLEQFIRGALGGARPLVGICFGHQAIAQALGGRAQRSQRGWGIGIQRYRTRTRAPWMEPPLVEFTVPVCHQDQVTHLPDGASVLASSPHCANFIVQFNESMIGIQGHPEFEPDYIRVLLDRRADIIPPAVRGDALESLGRRHDNLDIMRWIANFLGIK